VRLTCRFLIGLVAITLFASACGGSTGGTQADGGPGADGGGGTDASGSDGGDDPTVDAGPTDDAGGNQTPDAGGHQTPDAGPVCRDVDCDDPPAPTCAGNQVRTFEAQGHCQDDVCVYTSQDSPCASPPSGCFQSTGTCAGAGTCSYAPANGAACSDGSACTTGDVCQGGACTGQPLVCDDPPAPMCLDATTLRTFASTGTCSAGDCDYAATDSSCQGFCDAGACSSGGGDCTVGEWTDGDILTRGYVQSPTALARAADGTYHLAYADGPTEGLGLATRSPAGVWSHAIVDSGIATNSVTGMQASLAVDAQGGVHIAYYDADNRNLRYAVRATPAGTWSKATVAHDDDGIYGLELRVDAARTAHIVFMSGTHTNTARIRYARKPLGGSWAAVDVTPVPAFSPALALDAAGGLHVIYESYGEGGQLSFYEAYRPAGGSEFTRTEVVTRAHSPQIVIDAAGTTHLAGEDHSTGTKLGYYRRPAGATTFTRHLGDAFDSWSYQPSLAVDAFGTVHLATVVSIGPAWDVEHYLLHAQRVPGGPLVEAMVNQVGGESSFASVVVDPAGGVHIAHSYQNFADGLYHLAVSGLDRVCTAD
jgi:hypothetical protein